MSRIDLLTLSESTDSLIFRMQDPISNKLFKKPCFGRLFKKLQLQGGRPRPSEAYLVSTPQRVPREDNAADGLFQQPAEVWRMFDRIAPQYDLLNRLLSLRQDVGWRNKVAGFLGPSSDQHILDLATGTGDQLLALFSKNTRVQTAVGIDMAEKMLEKGREKIRAKNLTDRITLRRGDATAIPCENNQFDAVTLSFGIRNISNVSQALHEIYRVLKPQGRVLILEFSIPENPMIRPLYLFYLRHLLPKIGGRISGDLEAYRYLNQTIETFPYGHAFCNILSKAGFVNVEKHPLTLGVATIYQGDKSVVNANA